MGASKMKNDFSTLILVTRAGASTLFSTDSEPEMQELVELIKERALFAVQNRSGRRGRGVWVKDVDEAVHSSWCQDGGRNGLRSKPVEMGRQFPSCLIASAHLGLRNNEVAQALSRAKALGESEVTIRGVTLQYVEDLRVDDEVPFEVDLPEAVGGISRRRKSKPEEQP
jgi:hypothetical protein